MPVTVTEQPISVLEIAQEVEIAAPREKVFEVITSKQGEWFSPRFVKGTTVVAEPWVGGRVYEDIGDGAGVLWTMCTTYLPPSYVCYESPWGFSGGAATIVNDYELSEAEAGTLVRSKHKIIGFISEEMRASYEHHTTGDFGVAKLLTEYFATLT